MSRARTPGDRPESGFTGQRAPQPTAQAEPDASEAYDALTDLFLGDDDGHPVAKIGPSAPSTRSSPPSVAAPAARVEGLILGHLPVLASAWVQQYARQLSAELRGPVALVKLRAGEASLELVGVDHAFRPGHELTTTLESAAAAAARLARAWLVRVDDVAEPVLAELDTLDAVTLLTGADDAAVVASYRTIKQLFRPDAEHEEGGPEIRLAIMGSGADRAADATRNIERAAETFLGRQVTVAACVSKIGGGRSAILYRGPLNQPVTDILNWLIPAARAAKVATPAAPSAPDFSAAVELLDTPDAVAPPERTVSRLGHVPAAVPGRSAEPAATPSGPPPGLASQVHGLSPVAVSCPYAPDVQLATDPAGGLHVLAYSTMADRGAAAVAQLLAASAWAQAHRDLLCMALAPSLAPRGQPTLHLLTSDPKAVRSLVQAEIRLHLLARVEVPGQSVWYCTELN